MYYLIMTLTVAASIAANQAVRSIGTEYIGKYFVETAPDQVGISAPTPPEASPPSLVEGASLGEVTLVLLAGVSAGSMVASLSGPAAEASEASAVEPAAIAETVGEWAADIASAVPVSAPAALDATEQLAIGGSDSLVASAQNPENQAILALVRDTPHRRPDGTAFLPIATQRLFDMRWQVSRQSDVPMAHEIPGQVITNPATGTMIHATLAGVIEPASGKFPYLGMEVRAGDLLAYLRPTMGASERAQIEARIEQLVNLVSLTEKQIARLKEVMFVRYRVNKIEALKLEMDGHRRELASLQASLTRREALRATDDGVISHIDTVVGGTVGQGQAVFGIVDPNSLWVEAAAYDPAIAANIRSATALTSDGQGIDLEFVGGGLVLSNQAIPLRFSILNAPPGLSVGKPVTVIVRHAETIPGIPVPSASVIRDGDGRSIVWERITAETFLPRQVRAVRVAGDIMVVQSGLADGARVITEGASLLSQVR